MRLDDIFAASKPHPNDSNVFWFKILSAIGLFCITYFFAIWPICSKKFRGSTLLLGLANAFSGGLFLAAGVCHILPEAAEDLEKYNHKVYPDDPEGFPWPFFAATCSFSFVLLIDKVLFAGQHSHSHDQDNVSTTIVDQNTIIADQNKTDLHKSMIDRGTRNDLRRSILKIVENNAQTNYLKMSSNGEVKNDVNLDLEEALEQADREGDVMEEHFKSLVDRKSQLTRSIVAGNTAARKSKVGDNKKIHRSFYSKKNNY